jgi:hypothetical protein
VKKCEICGTNLSNDLFATVAEKPVCSICTIKYVGGSITPARIQSVRARLGLAVGEYLQQDNQREAARILDRHA